MYIFCIFWAVFMNHFDMSFYSLDIFLLNSSSSTPESYIKKEKQLTDPSPPLAPVSCSVVHAVEHDVCDVTQSPRSDIHLFHNLYDNW
jgi:hypothetical protein